MAIPFNTPPDEYSLRRLQDLVEELYVILVVHLMNQPPPKPPPPDEQRRRAPSCQDDEKNGQENVGRDGGDSDSDPDACAATTTTPDAAAMAEVAAEIDLVCAEQRRLPHEFLSPTKRLPEIAQDSPPSGILTAPCRCACQTQLTGTFQGHPGDAQARAAESVRAPAENASTSRNFSLGPFLSVVRNQVFTGGFWASVACFLGYRLFCVHR